MKSLLGLVLPLLVAVSALPARAAIMEATYFGRIYQGTDFAGVIGTPGSINESTFTAVYTYDTAFSNRTTSERRTHWTAWHTVFRTEHLHAWRVPLVSGPS